MSTIKIAAVIILSVIFSNTNAQVWGTANSRTETRDNADLSGGQGAVSGFFETPSPVNYPAGASSWWHLLDVRHSNPANNFAMQFAGSFFNQDLYFRKTNNGSNLGWNKILMVNAGTLGVAPGAALELVDVNSKLGGNEAHLKILLKRHTSGAGWEQASTRIQAMTDVSEQGYLDFNPKGGPHGMAFGVNNQEYLRISPNGNIGIGSSNPGGKLQVSDDGAVEPAKYGTVQIVRPSSPTDNNFHLSFVRNGLSVSGMGYTNNDNILGIWSANTNAGVPNICFTPDQNVGIGTTDTKGYRLAVNGNAIFTKVKVMAYGVWADYVFEPTYNLPTLKQVEAFIKQHKHLPDVPSAKEVEANGLDLGESQALLLKKIEELTLYVIEQSKQLEKQKDVLENQGKLLNKLQAMLKEEAKD